MVKQLEMLLNLLQIILLLLLHQVHGLLNSMLHGVDIAKTLLQLGKLSVKILKLVKSQQRLQNSIVLNTTQFVKKMKLKDSQHFSSSKMERILENIKGDEI